MESSKLCVCKKLVKKSFLLEVFVLGIEMFLNEKKATAIVCLAMNRRH